MTTLEHTTSTAPSSLNRPVLIYEGQIIHDRGEMLSLTDMWRAAGTPEGRRPDDWKKDSANRAFLDHVAAFSNASVEGIWKGQRGAAGGTWAHWQVALAYAKYLSPEFHMWCNTVVRDRMQGLVEPRSYDVLPVAKIASASGIVFESYYKIAQVIGLDRNQSALSANRATKSLTGQDPLTLLGHSQLEAPRPEQLLTPTDIGKQVGVKSARVVNEMLATLGLQICGRDAKGKQYWEPTAEGLAFSVMLDTGKKHDSGTPVRQLKWHSGVVSQVRSALDG